MLLQQMRKKTGGMFVLGISWLYSYNNLVAVHAVKNIAFTSLQNDAWSNATAVATIPDGIQKMVILLATFPYCKEDKFYFNNIKVAEVNDLLKKN
jgi:hypothetical protein